MAHPSHNYRYCSGRFRCDFLFNLIGQRRILHAHRVAFLLVTASACNEVRVGHVRLKANSAMPPIWDTIPRTRFTDVWLARTPFNAESRVLGCIRTARKDRA